MTLSTYNHAPYHPIGAATLLVWDAQAGPDDPLTGEPHGAWRSVGKVADAAVVMTAQSAGQELALKGLSQPVTRRLTAQRHSLSFRLLEHAGPEALELLFGLGRVPQAAASELVATSEVLRLYGGDWCEVAHPFGIQTAAPAPVSALTAAVGDSGGTIPPDTYYYWVAPVVPGDGGVLYGTPAASGPVVVGSGETVTLGLTPPADYSPKRYAVFVHDADALAEAKLVDFYPAADGTIQLTHHSLGGGYSAAALRVFSYDGATEFAAGVDFSADAAKGLVKRLPGGAIPSGARVLVAYSYQRPASVLTVLGDPVALERYRRVKLLQLAPEDGAGNPGGLDPASWRETGVEWELHRVAVGAADSSYACTPDDFSPGAAVVWDCLYSAEHARVGAVRSTFGVLATYE